MERGGVEPKGAKRVVGFGGSGVKTARTQTRSRFGMPERQIGQGAPRPVTPRQPSQGMPGLSPLPSFIPPRVLIPKQRGAIQGGLKSWKALLLIMLLVLPWLLACVSWVGASSTTSSTSIVSEFIGCVHPYIRQWLPTWLTLAACGLLIGIVIRLGRCIQPRVISRRVNRSNDKE